MPSTPEPSSRDFSDASGLAAVACTVPGCALTSLVEYVVRIRDADGSPDAFMSEAVCAAHMTDFFRAVESIAGMSIVRERML